MKLIILFLFSLKFSLIGISAQADHIEQASTACQLTTLDGKTTYDLQELKGKVVYVDFWASWCPPCVKSFPFLNQLEHDLKDKGLHIVGVNLDEKPADAQAFLANNPVDFSIVADASKQCAKAFELMAMPTSYLIDKKGNVRHIHQGFRSDESKQLRTLITQLLME
ncbi:TlpA family protein disulfide reductase [Nitrosomonas sp. JL21]|nr:TlpA family protein disulfide reductase [Nitrosomonas sp. JL21]